MAVNSKKKTDEEPEDGAPVGVLTPPKEGEALFDGDAKSLRVTKDVNPSQLLNEVDERLGDRKKYQVVGHLEDDDAEVSEENPLTLYVHGGADMRTVRGVVESHEKDDDYGVTEEEKEINALRERLRNGEDLPTGELNTLLRAML